jgi:hypothetical protein
MLLAARGEFCDSSLWILCELNSPVGRSARGPGINGQHQRLLAVALAGGDMMIPAIVATPTDEMTVNGLGQTQLAAQLEHLVERLGYVADRIKAYVELVVHPAIPCLYASRTLPA